MNRLARKPTERVVTNTDSSEDWCDLGDSSTDTPRKDPALFLMGEDNGDNVISCDICKITVSGSIPFEQHLRSNKHYKMAQKAYMKSKYGKKFLEVKKSLEAGEEGNVEQQPNVGVDDNGTEVLVCTLCNKICTGMVCYQLHMEGRSHAKKVRQKKLIQELTSNPDINLDAAEEEGSGEGAILQNLAQNKPIAFCEVCNKKFYAPQSYQDHLSSGSHKKMLQKRSLIQKMRENGDIHASEGNEMAVEPNVEDAMDIEWKPFTSCSVCKKEFSGPEPYQQHLDSNCHKKRVKQVGLVDKMKALDVKADDDGSFFCHDCNKGLYGPEAFQQHLKGSSHAKHKAKVLMMESLQKKYPAMVLHPVASSVTADIDNEDAAADLDSSVIILCSVCHKSFSGPEAAHAHFISQRHAKAMRHHEFASRGRISGEPTATREDHDGSQTSQK